MKATEYQSNGQTFAVHTLKGEVLETAKETRTNIHQGRSRVVHTGHPDAPTQVVPGSIYSSHSTSQEVWVKGVDDVEYCVKLRDQSARVRAGQRVTFQWLGQPNGTPFTMANDATRESAVFGDIDVARQQMRFSSLTDAEINSKTSGYATAWLVAALGLAVGGFIGKTVGEQQVHQVQLRDVQRCVDNAPTSKTRQHEDSRIACGWQVDTKFTVDSVIALTSPPKIVSSFLEQHPGDADAVNAIQGARTARQRAMAFWVTAGIALVAGLWMRTRASRFKARCRAAVETQFETDTLIALTKAQAEA
jgi:uncharacterized membrane-anchored protein YhcB (DUF1043 family)